MALTWALVCHGQCLGKVTRAALSRSLVFESWYKDEKLKAESQPSVCDVLEQGQQILGNNYSFVAWKGEMGVSYKWLLFIYLWLRTQMYQVGIFLSLEKLGTCIPFLLLMLRGRRGCRGISPVPRMLYPVWLHRLPSLSLHSPHGWQVAPGCVRAAQAGTASQGMLCYQTLPHCTKG